jgi:REP element-mobilizing transposase RayT
MFHVSKLLDSEVLISTLSIFRPHQTESFLMTTARSELVDVDVTPWYHCISKCVRSALLLQDGPEDRKQWIEDRLKMLSENFSVAVAGFSVLDNHLHVLCRLDPEDSSQWTSEQVVRRWMEIYPPRKLAMDDSNKVEAWIEQQVKDVDRVEVLRGRLANLGWFMKSLKEPLARMANKSDGCSGAFWASRYKSIGILDDEALLATCAYIDLNPLAAGISKTPENSPHTSIRQRVAHVESQGKLECLKAALFGSVAGSQAAENVEQDHWLVPIEDRRGGSNAKTISARKGMLESFSLGSYLLLVDYTGRLYREGKARMTAAVKEVFDRLGTSDQFWSKRIKKMLVSRDLRGSFFAADPTVIRQLSVQRGKRLANLSPQLSV